MLPSWDKDIIIIIIILITTYTILNATLTILFLQRILSVWFNMTFNVLMCL